MYRDDELEKERTVIDIAQRKADLLQKELANEFMSRQLKKRNFLKDVLPLASIIVTLIGAIIAAMVQRESIRASIMTTSYSSTVLAKQQSYSKMCNAMEEMIGFLRRSDSNRNFNSQFASQMATITRAYYELEFFLPRENKQDVEQQIILFKEECRHFCSLPVGLHADQWDRVISELELTKERFGTVALRILKDENSQTP